MQFYFETPFGEMRERGCRAPQCRLTVRSIRCCSNRDIGGAA
jgi:hypothetical protein